MDRDYKFFRRPLSLKVAKEIILEHLPRRIGFLNSDITKIVVEHHEKFGGLPPKKSPTIDISRNIIKPALGDLKKAGSIKNPIQDTWIIFDGEGPDYEYYGVRLVPEVVKKLVVEYLPGGRVFTKHEISDLICKKHVQLGGLIEKKTTIIHNIKKALIQLKKKGLVKFEDGEGWSVCSPSSVDVPAEIADEGDTVVSSSAMSSDEELGVGSGVVYVYYYPIYKEMADLKGESIWECKIGKSVVDAYGRVKSQTGTSMPECPHIALVLNTDFENDLEKAIQLILKIRGQCLDSAPGKEWFITNPAEVKAIYSFIV